MTPHFQESVASVVRHDSHSEARAQTEVAHRSAPLSEAELGFWQTLLGEVSECELPVVVFGPPDLDGAIARHAFAEAAVPACGFLLKPISIPV